MASAPLYGPQVVSKTALSPQDLVRLQLAQQLLKSGTDTSPVESPWQGVARLGQALAGGYLNYRLGEDQKQRQGETTNAMANALRAGSATWTNPMGGTEEAPPGAGPLPGAPIAPGQSVPIPGAVGGMQGIIASLAGSNSPEAQAKGADLAFTQMTEQQKLANALKQDEGQWQNKIKYQPQLAAEEFNATAPLKLNLRQSELDQDLRHKPTLAGLEANARLPSQMSLAGFTANANAQAGLSVAEQRLRPKRAARRRRVRRGSRATT